MRSKVAVAARQANVDPVGSCVGMKGQRIQKIVDELGGEKIDVVLWDPDMSVYIANALSPAQVLSVELNEEHKTASVLVPERMLSLAIGKEGQNARLAAKLTGWRIDIKSALSDEDSEEMDDEELARRAVDMLRAEAANNGHAIDENGYVTGEPVEDDQELQVEHVAAEVEAEA
jgi:N utilization substance protein A